MLSTTKYIKPSAIKYDQVYILWSGESNTMIVGITFMTNDKSAVIAANSETN